MIIRCRYNHLYKTTPDFCIMYIGLLQYFLQELNSLSSVFSQPETLICNDLNLKCQNIEYSYWGGLQRTQPGTPKPRFRLYFADMTKCLDDIRLLLGDHHNHETHNRNHQSACSAARRPHTH